MLAISEWLRINARNNGDGSDVFDPWPYINTIRAGAERIVSAAMRFGMGLKDSANDRYENGKDIFSSLVDRMHLSAVVAHCAAFCAKAEAVVKNVMRPDGTPEISAEHCWPHNSELEVERHDRNLGLAVPEIVSQHDFNINEHNHDREVPDREQESDYSRDSGGGHSR